MQENSTYKLRIQVSIRRSDWPQSEFQVVEERDTAITTMREAADLLARIAEVVTDQE